MPPSFSKYTKDVINEQDTWHSLSTSYSPYGDALDHFEGRRRVMVYNATFNNISVISCRSVLLLEETGVPRENHQPVAKTDKLDHTMLHRRSGIRTHNVSDDEY